MSLPNSDKLEKAVFTSKIVDLSYLNESLSGDLEMLKQMSQLFLNQSPEKMTLLQKNINEKDFTAIRETSHFLKSTFSIMGLQSKDELAKIEQLSSQEKEHTTIVALNQNILNNFDESIIEYKRIISNL